MRRRPPPPRRLLLAALTVAAGCGGARPRPTTAPAPAQVVEMEPLRIAARRDEHGHVQLEAYDARTLFRKGTEALDAGRCEQAIAHYERLAEEFPESRWLSAALYNAGWCALQGRDFERAASLYERLLAMRPRSRDAKDARFQLASALFELHRWERLRKVAEALLDLPELSADERIEAMAYRALALLGRAERLCGAGAQAPAAGGAGAAGAGQAEPSGGRPANAGARRAASGRSPSRATVAAGGEGSAPVADTPPTVAEALRREAAEAGFVLRPAVTDVEGLDCDGLLQETERQARAALSLGRLQERRGEPVSATEALAAANYVLGETNRLRAEAIEIPVGDAATQHEALERRARYTLAAQRAYTDTVRWGAARWSAAAGYRIGALYDGLWAAIDRAPIPPPPRPLRPAALQVYREEYRAELRRRIRPLLRHAVRYWELTLLMIERRGIEGPWAERVREGLRRARQRLLADTSEAADGEAPSRQSARGAAAAPSSPGATSGPSSRGAEPRDAGAGSRHPEERDGPPGAGR